MTIEQEKIDHAIAMLQALRDGKRIEGFNHEAVIHTTWFAIDEIEQLLHCLTAQKFETRLLPEPLEEWKVVYWSNGRKFTTIYKTQQEAERFVSKISYHPIAFEIERHPAMIYHMKQVMP